MVYKKSDITVLLGPEKYRSTVEASEDYLQDYDGEQFPVRARAKKVGENQVFEKIGDSNVYKRTRPFQQVLPRPKLERFHTGLELSGQKVQTDEVKLKLKSGLVTTAASSATVRNDDWVKLVEPEHRPKLEREKTSTSMLGVRELDSALSYQSMTLPRSKRDRASHNSANHTPSLNFLTEFGLHSERTDTFSGHQRRRGTNAVAQLERQLERSAARHIRACQIVGNVKRSSKANMSYEGLKQTVSPLHSPLSHCSTDRARNQNHSRTSLSEKAFHRSNHSLDSGASVVPYMIQMRKNIGSISRLKSLGSPRPDPLQTINSRTMIVGSGIDIS